jgi:hypothetical protein
MRGAERLAERLAEEAFADVVRRFPALPELVRVRAWPEPISAPHIFYQADFANDFRSRWHVETTLAECRSAAFNPTALTRWGRAIYERVQRELLHPPMFVGADFDREDATSFMIYGAEEGPDVARIPRMAMDQIAALRTYARPDGYIEYQAIDFTELFQQQPPRHPTATEVRELQRQMERDMLAYANQAPERPAALTVETITRAMRMMRGEVGRGAVTAEAETKAERLLLDWLSPDQKQQYQENKSFIVVGSDTGRRYRIMPGRAYNVMKLTDGDQADGKICFQPSGAPAIGDIMLAQKIALETREREALAVANEERQFLAGMQIGEGACNCPMCRRTAWRFR